MQNLLVALCVGLVASRPQVDLDIVKEIFGGGDAERLGTNSYGVANQGGGAAKQVGGVANQGGVAGGGVTKKPVPPVVQQTKPADYVPPAESETAKAIIEVDTVYQNCSEYTASLGYMCVPYYQCDKGTIVTNGAGLIDVRGGFGNLSPENSKCPGFLDVCCKDPDFTAPPPTRLAHTPKCGRRNGAGVGARIQGFKENESQFGEWPHMCAVLNEKVVAGQEPANLYKCGGSLIAPGVVLTAAHCLEGLTNTPAAVKIRCGEWDTQKTTEPYPHQDRYVAQIKIHPEFDNRSLANDFAVLFLAQEFKLDHHIDTICLPRPREFFVGGQCYATGWGKDRFGSQGEYQIVLKEIELPVVNSVTCQNSLRNTRLGQKFKLDESFMCAGGKKGLDTCKGDGGSPLVCPSKSDPNQYEQAGIVAWGIGCGEDGTPGVYANVAKAVCWIDQVMTCQAGAKSGKYASYWSYDERDCGSWLNETLQRIDRFRQGGGARLAPVFDQMRQSYQECNVQWNKKVDDGSSYIGVRIAGDGEEVPAEESATEATAETVTPAAAGDAVDNSAINAAHEAYIPDIVGDPVTVETVEEKILEVTTEAAVNFFEETVAPAAAADAVTEATS
jgi:secreted trypsin-like serine protease